MATSVTGSINALASLTATGATNVSGVSSTLPVSVTLNQSTYTSGNNAANKLSQLWCDTRTLANGATEDIDLYVPIAVDLVGTAMTMTKLKFLYIKCNSTSETEYIVVGNKGATSGWTSWFGANTHSIKLTGGASVTLEQPGATAYAVGNSTTNHLLTITATASTSLTYTIIVAGTVS